MAHRMPNTVEQVGDDKVKLTVEVPAHDVHHAVEHAANDLAASARIPGFRKGKVPMPLLIKRVGRERLYTEAVESHIGGWFWGAATRARVNPVAQPEYDYELPASDHEDWRFSATVEVQPKPEPADWTQLEVPKHEAEVPEEAVQAELQALQRTVAELVPVEGRPAAEGDTVVVDLVADDGSAQRDYIVELGSERLVEEIENGVRGLATGEQREVAYELADGSRRNATVVLKEVKERVLPPLDDELAKLRNRVRDARRAARRHRVAASRSDRRGARRQHSAALPSTSSSRRRTCRPRGRWSSYERASCSRGWRAASKPAGSTPAPTCS